MDGGGRYDASRSGRVSVENPAHVRQILKASEASGDPIREALYSSAGTGPSRECPACSFIGYMWQRDCPRGHGPMPARTPETAR